MPGPGDFNWALSTAADLLAGRDPYGFTPTADRIPYPLPVALFGLPLLGLPARVAAAVFFGCSSGLLAWGVLRSGEPWRLLVLLSWPFCFALVFAQWSVLIAAAWYLPTLAPVVALVKPQTAAPIVLARVRAWRQLVPAGLLLGASLVVYPAWPLRWLAMLGSYERLIPALVWPWGPLVLGLALASVAARRADDRSLALLGIVCLPLRAAYDLVALWLLVPGPLSALCLTVLSWAPWLLGGFGMAFGPGRWAWWVVPLLVLPAAISVLAPTLAVWVRRRHTARRSAPDRAVLGR